MQCKYPIPSLKAGPLPCPLEWRTGPTPFTPLMCKSSAVALTTTWSQKMGLSSCPTFVVKDRAVAPPTLWCQSRAIALPTLGCHNALAYLGWNSRTHEDQGPIMSHRPVIGSGVWRLLLSIHGTPQKNWWSGHGSAFTEQWGAGPRPCSPLWWTGWRPSF